MIIIVSREQIEVVLDSVLGVGLDVKCGPTIAEMHSTLDKISYHDQYTQLTEKGYLNPLEEKDYNKKLERLQALDTYFDEHGTDDLMGAEESMYDEREQIVEELFSYGRRLVEGYETSFPVNLDDYRDKAGTPDNQYEMWEHSEYYGEDVYTHDITTKLGDYEKETIENQLVSVNVNPNDTHIVTTEGGGRYEILDDERLLSMNDYFSGDVDHINYKISHEKYLDKLDNETKKHISNIDSLMEESSGLPYNTLLFRGGHFNIHTRVGETISFNGYQSTSFQHSTAQFYKEGGGFGETDDSMMYLIHAPKGTKGIAGNDSRFMNGFEEHEYVLPRNTKMKVINIDYEKKVCEVVIEE